MATRVRAAGLAEAQSLFDLTEALPGPRPGVHGVDGHRARMRTRLLTAGPDAVADHEMLEMVLFLALPRRDTKLNRVTVESQAPVPVDRHPLLSNYAETLRRQFAGPAAYDKHTE